MDRHRRQHCLRFGPYEFDEETLELYRGADRVSLPPKPSLALELLLHSAGSLVTRERLQSHVWPDTIIEFDQGLNTCMRHLRAALGDDADAPTYIETVPRRGYRFIAPIKDVSGGPPWRWPVLVAGVAALLLGGAWLWRGAASPEDPTRLAILPLEMIGGSEADSLFAEGVTEELLTTLASADQTRLQVLGRTSASRLAKEYSLAEMQAEFGIDYVLQGRVRQEPAGYKITTQLVETRTSVAVWSGEYRRATASTSIPGQENLSGQVTQALENVLGLTLAVEPSPVPPSRVATAWMVARHLVTVGDGEAREQAVSLLEEVLDADPRFGAAHVALARVHVDQGRYQEAEASIAKAVALLGSDPHVLMERGRLHLRQWRVAEAGRDLATAVAGAPQDGRAQHTYGYYLSVTGHHREALQVMMVAEEIDPVSVSVAGDAGLFAFWAGQPRRAIQQCKAVLRYALARNRLMVHRCLMHNYFAIGAFEDALLQAAEVLEAAGATEETSTLILHAESPAQGMDRYFTWAARPENLSSSQGGDTSYRIALASAGAGDVDGALAALEHAFLEREPRLIEILVEPRLDPVRGEPRFEAIVEGLGLFR